jgi:phosphatidate cytidylyltransferase
MSTPRARRHARRNQRSELLGRILIAVPALFLALALIGTGGLVFLAGVFVIGAIGMHELFAMYPRAHPVRLAGFLALAALLLGAYYGGAPAVLLAAVATLPVLFLLTLLQAHPRAGALGLTLLAIYWIGLALAHAILLRDRLHGGGLVLDVLIGTLASDTGAYIGGHLFGEHALAPRISPGKTVEGLLIGMICAIGGVWLASRFQEWMPSGHALVLGVGIAALAPLGDLFESFIKRDAHVKDSGRIFGPHGGVLDRLDALMFAIVVGYYIWQAYS